MQYSDLVEDRSRRHVLLVACAAALAVAFMFALLQPARAAGKPPTVPPEIQAPAGNELFEVGHAAGTQNYICLPSTTAPSGFAYQLFTPQATLFRDEANQKQIITHFFSPNLNPDPSLPPAEQGTIRAAWQDSKDTSIVWAAMAPGGSVPQPDAIAWLLLKAVGAQDGLDRGNTLSHTTYIQRLNTTGGLAPSTGCAAPADVGNKAFVPYTADYFFYRQARGR